MGKYLEEGMKKNQQEIIDLLERVYKNNLAKERKEKELLMCEEKKREENTDEIFLYIRKKFPNIENENAPFACSSKFYRLIEDLILIGQWFRTDKKLFQTSLHDWKLSDDYVELFKKTIDFYRKEIYDKIPG